jgi:CheY-like chemotaxis protein
MSGEQLPKAELRPHPGSAPATQTAPGAVSDDRYERTPDDRVLLIIEDDTRFARIILDAARERGFKGIVATGGAEGLALARQLRPDAITLDIRIPDLDGWKILDSLKHGADTRHIPVHVISVDEQRQRGLEQGVIEHLTKPVSRENLTAALDRLGTLTARAVKHLLVVAEDEAQRTAIVNLVGEGDVEIAAVGTDEEALRAIQEREFNCVVVDLNPVDTSGFDLIAKLHKASRGWPVPVIVYTDRDLTKREAAKLQKLAKGAVVKGATSPEQVLDETSLFLHRIEANLPESKRDMLREAQQKDSSLKGKLALIVDDDVRNVFALSSVLERQGMCVLFAESGKDGLETLLANPEVDVVLMDLMMPDLDGHETIRRIRAIPQFASLPIIAVTAKAMRADREQCLEAGATDYISKPVDIPQLISLLRVWSYRRRG